MQVPAQNRPQTLTEHLDEVRELHETCKGNLIRVHEELAAQEIVVSYSNLTRFCRINGIGVKAKLRTGQYHFEPGEEMQHDTSPHRVLIGDTVRLVQCASLVLCYSRGIYAQVYPSFTRFWCKVFLQDAAQYFNGTAQRCMIDNTHVVVLHGTGSNAVFVPEMNLFARRIGTSFAAHEKGDANRSAHVERSFDFLEKNFYPGRVFQDFDDLNRQLVDWCNKVNNSFKRSIQAVPTHLLAVERGALSRLPAHLPPIYQIHERCVDVECFVTLHTNRYSVPEKYLGRCLQIHESKTNLRIFEGHELVCEHQRQTEGRRFCSILPGHHSLKPRTSSKLPSCPQELELLKQGPPISEMVKRLRACNRVQPTRAIRRLHQIWIDYPGEPVSSALKDALQFGLFNMSSLEEMVLDRINGDFFRIQTQEAKDET